MKEKSVSGSVSWSDLDPSESSHRSAALRNELCQFTVEKDANVESPRVSDCTGVRYQLSASALAIQSPVIETDP